MKNTDRIKITHGGPDLPYDWETERALLASILMDYRVLDDVRYRVNESDFARSHNAELYRLAKSITDKGGACDLTLLLDHAQRAGLESFGGASYIMGLVNAAPTPEFAPAYADRIHELACIRRTVMGVKGVIEIVKNGAAFREVVAELERVTTDAGGSSLSTDAAWSHLIEGVDEAYEETRKAYETGESPPYLRTGISELDEHLNAGPGDLVVVAARPAMGKTVYADQWAGHVAKNYGSVGFFSLEMPKRQIGQRNLARQSGVGLKAITDGRNILRHEIEDLVRARNELTDLSFFVDDLPSLSPATLKMKVRALKRKMENEGRPALVMVVIDYLQLAEVEDSGSDNRTVAIGRFTRMCKVLARDENIIVVLVSQLNRSLESRTNKRPIPSDLRESGSIEQDSDIILFIYRDEVYDPASADKGMAEIIIAKQRQGSLATAKVSFNGSVSRFGSATQTGATRMVGNG